MKKRLVLAAVAVLTVTASVALAQGGFKQISEALSGFNEVPVISTTGQGEFHARISNDEAAIEYELTYSDLEGTITQSHIHFGPPNNTGGIVVWLCSNLASPPTPAGVQGCPVPGGTITGVITAANVVAQNPNQGIEAGAMGELVDAIRAGKTYVNVHTSKWPAGEIRSQIVHQGH